MRIGFMAMAPPYTKSLKSASVEVFNWNLLNAMDPGKQRHVFATIPKDKVCACGCYGRHTTDSMLGILDWSMNIMLGGVRPWTNHDLQDVDSQRSLRAGWRLGFSGGLFKAKGDWAWYQQICVVHPGVAQ